MKPIKLIMVMAALLLGGSAARAALEFPTVPTYTPGKSSQLAVEATTPEGASAIQFTVTLPDGFTLSSTSLTIDKSRATAHTYRMNKVSDTSYKCVIYSNSNTPFASTEGKLFSLPLKAASTATKGDYELNFTEISTADASGQETPMPDATVTLPVVILASSVKVEPSPANLMVGEEVKLTAVVTPAEAEQTVTWRISSGSSYVSISEDGVVKGLARGSARIVATTTDGSNRTAYCTVNVTDIAVTEMVMSKSTMDLRMGTTERLSVTVKPDNATNKNVTWSSSSTSVLTVDSDGNITPRNVGTATVTATAADGSGVKATCQVTVLPTLTTALTLNQTSLSLRVGDTDRLTATVTPSDASQQLTWTSSDAAIASVDAWGYVTAKAIGEATITVAATDGSGMKAECRVTVAAVQASLVIIEPSTLDLYVGEEVKLTAQVYPADASQAVKWSVTFGANKISVSEDGVVKGLATGTARVRATTTDGSSRFAYCVVTIKEMKVSELVMSQGTMNLRMGTTGKLSVTVKPDNASNKNVTWSSSSTSVLTVDSDGNITPRSVGTATVTATAADGSDKTASCRVTVLPALTTAITLNQTALSLRVNDTARLTATVAPSGASQQLTWTSSDAAIASVDASGNVTAKGVGAAVITASATDGSGVKAECRVTVIAPLVSSVTLNLSSTELRLGETATLSATVLPENAGNRTVKWSTDNAAAVTVDQNGNIEAVGIGTAVITATATDGSAKAGRCEVRVSRPLATRVTMSDDELTLRVTETARLTATVTPSTASQTMKWSSSSPHTATVDASGNVTAIAAGTTIITATTTDGSERWCSCFVTVLAPLTTAITLSQTSLSMRVNDTAILRAIVSPEGASLNQIWSSSHEEVASVDVNGIITARSVGETIITVASTDGSGVIAQCRVTVGAALVSSVTLDRQSVELRPGESETLTATVRPDNAGNRTVAWTTTDATVATVDQSGHIVAVATGSAVITAISTDGTAIYATCQVTVLEPLTTAINLSQTSLSLRVNDTTRLTANISPADASHQLEWSSSTPEVVSVDETGTVTARSVGEAVITVSATDGSGIKAECEVTVVAPLATGIELDHSELTLRVSETTTLTARVIPDGAIQAVGWNSSNASVASVNADGEVTALSEGIAIITVATLDGTGLTAACIVNVTEGSGLIAVDNTSQAVTVKAEGSDIIIAGVPDNYEIQVVNASGIMVYSGHEHRINGLSAGFHMVIVDSLIYKVILR